MEVNNTFDAGMNSDASKLRQPATTYPKAMNFRPISDAGSSVGALTNIRGNECAITFPAIRGVYNLKFKYHEEGNYTGVLNITINGQTTTNITINTDTQVSDIASYIIGMSNCYNNPSAVNPTFAVAYNDESLVIYQSPEYSSCSPAVSVEPNITITTVSGMPELLFTTSDGGEYPWITAYVPAYTGIPVVIGSTFINEDIYLFTCPASNTVGSGQIWLLQFNEITKVSTIKLIYNSILNFSIDYPIAPSAALGRYELTNLQRIYWTDYNNPVRSVNAKDANLMAIAPSIINLIPSSLLSIPTLTNIIDQSATNPLDTSKTYQCAYRLVKTNGGLTTYSTCSNIVYPIMFNTAQYNDTTLKYASLRGYLGSYNKALEFTVDGIDTNYDSIEFVIIERKYPNEDTFFAYKFDTQLILGQSSIKTVYRNPDDKEEITLQEFLLEGSSFTHCKTLESKDNRLFFGNVKEDLSKYLENYDTRAYRFNNSSPTGNVLKYETDTSATFVQKLGPGNYKLQGGIDIDEKYDMIPVYNLGLATDENPFYQTAKYQANSTIIGGEGPNISYKFGSKLLRSDYDYNMPASTNTSYSGTNEDNNYPNSTSSNTYKNGFRIAANLAGPTVTGMNPYSNLAPSQSYPSNNVAASMGLEYFGGTFKSYQHNEIYRFGIVFYTKSSKTSFVKWIGDIKFPDYGDSPAPGLEGRTNSNIPCPDFRSVFSDGVEVAAYSVVPYIQFDVNIPQALADIINGYEIVRVKRETQDMYIKAHGMVDFANNSNVTTGSLPGIYSITNPGTTNNQGTYNDFSGAQVAGVMTFDSFTHIVDGYNSRPLKFNNGSDKIKFTERYHYTNIAGVETDTGTPSLEFHTITKYYDVQQFYNDTFKYSTSKTSYVATGDNDGTFYNYWSTVGLTASALGNPTTVLYINSPGTATASALGIQGFSGGAANSNNYNKILAIHYDPSKLSSQYGGRKYINRTSSEYISTGSFYPITIKDAGIKSIKTFGGDIYHGILDVHKNIKNWGQSTLGSSTVKKSLAIYFPTQSIYNIELRDGDHVNRNLNLNGVFADVADQYDYLFSYSYENTVKTFYPEPAVFNLTNEWNNRVQWSVVKVNGETTDSWANIPILNFYDVEGAYGGINAFSILNNNLYFIQDRAIGYLYINPITTITGANGLPVTLGKGSTVEKHEYLSIDAGTKHQWSVFRSNSAITFIDSRHKKIYLFNGQSLVPISDVKGAKGFINKVLHDDILVNDNPIIGKGILVTYDHFNNEFLYTFRNSFTNTELGDPNLLDDEGTYEVYTLVYSDLIGAFSSFYDFTPYIYINNRNKLFSIKDLASRSIYLHNIGNYSTFYGTTFPSCVSSVINPNPLNTKVFDNISWISQSVKESVKWKDELNDYLGDSDDVPYLDDTVTRFRCYDEYQNSDWLTLAQTNPITNLRRSEQGWNIQVPRNKVNYDTTAIDTKSIFDPTILTKVTFGDRMRDKYLTVDLEYDNTLNNRFIIHNIKTTYRISDR